MCTGVTVSAGTRLVLLLIILLCPARQVVAASFETFLEPARVVDISTPYRDRIARVLVRENDQVHQGMVLAELDSEVLKSRLEQARAAAEFHGEIDAAGALVTLRKNRLRSLEKLKKSGTVRPMELENARAELAMARAKLLSAREQQEVRRLEAEIIEAQVREKKLTSPLDGVVITIHKQEAELIGGTDLQPLLTLAQLNPLHAVFHLPPEAAHGLQAGRDVPLQINGHALTGTVDYVSPVIDAQSGTVTVRISVKNDDGRLDSGSRCTLNLTSEPTISSGDDTHDGTTAEPAADQGSLQ